MASQHGDKLLNPQKKIPPAALEEAKTKVMDAVLNVQDIILFGKEIEDPPKMIRDLKLTLKKITDKVRAS